MSYNSLESSIMVISMAAVGNGRAIVFTMFTSTLDCVPTWGNRKGWIESGFSEWTFPFSLFLVCYKVEFILLQEL